MITLLLVVVGLLLALGALLRLSEPHLIYLPDRHVGYVPSALGLPYEDVALMTADGVPLAAWFLATGSSSAPVVLFLHGNAGNISHRLEKLALLHQLGADVLIFDYRGYGRSEGSPDEAGLYRDARAAYEYLRTRRDVSPARIVLYGESLGTAVAVDLAAEQEVAGVILEAAFTSAADVARELYPWLPVRWIMRSRFDSLAKIGRVRAPLLILHSRHDEFFAMRHAERLLAAAPGPKRLVALEGGHNDAFVVSAHTYREALSQFLVPRVPEPGR